MCKETDQPAKDRLGKGVISAVDGGTALQSSSKKAGKPVLKGMNHEKHVFTPRSRLLKSELTPESVKTLKKLCKASRGKKPQVRESARFFHCVGGDNLAENLFTHTRNTMRRGNVLGRLSHSTSSQWKSVRALSSAFLLRSPGLKAVLQACACFRSDFAKGKVKGVAPKNC